LRDFRWLTANAIPLRLDLRECGWNLLPEERATEECMGVAHTMGMPPAGWVRFLSLHGRQSRRLILLVGINDAVDRARLLRLGFGEVMAEDVELAELEARAIRLAELEDTLPRYRRLGRLILDLLAREAFVDDRPLGLHPREFGLLWRLADTPDRPVSKQSLVKDVWRLGFVPETNSLAVHVSRLRGKLGIVGLEGLVETAPSGGYCLRSADGQDRPAIPLGKGDAHLDDYSRETGGREAFVR
jgi:two-component system OmpR family response regulator